MVIWQAGAEPVLSESLARGLTEQQGPTAPGNLGEGPECPFANSRCGVTVAPSTLSARICSNEGVLLAPFLSPMETLCLWDAQEPSAEGSDQTWSQGFITMAQWTGSHAQQSNLSSAVAVC